MQVLPSSDLSIDLKYAENITLTAAVFEHLQLPRSHLEHTYGNLWMKINADKYKVLFLAHYGLRKCEK